MFEDTNFEPLPKGYYEINMYVNNYSPLLIKYIKEEGYGHFWYNKRRYIANGNYYIYDIKTDCTNYPKDKLIELAIKLKIEEDIKEIERQEAIKIKEINRQYNDDILCFKINKNDFKNIHKEYSFIKIPESLLSDSGNYIYLEFCRFEPDTLPLLYSNVFYRCIFELKDFYNKHKDKILFDKNYIIWDEFLSKIENFYNNNKYEYIDTVDWNSNNKYRGMRQLDKNFYKDKEGYNWLKVRTDKELENECENISLIMDSFKEECGLIREINNPITNIKDMNCFNIINHNKIKVPEFWLKDMSEYNLYFKNIVTFNDKNIIGINYIGGYVGYTSNWDKKFIEKIQYLLDNNEVLSIAKYPISDKQLSIVREYINKIDEYIHSIYNKNIKLVNTLNIRPIDKKVDKFLKEKYDDKKFKI